MCAVHCPTRRDVECLLLRKPMLKSSVLASEMCPNPTLIYRIAHRLVVLDIP